MTLQLAHVELWRGITMFTVSLHFFVLLQIPEHNVFRDTFWQYTTWWWYSMFDELSNLRLKVHYLWLIGHHQYHTITNFLQIKPHLTK